MTIIRLMEMPERETLVNNVNYVPFSTTGPWPVEAGPIFITYNKQ